MPNRNESESAATMQEQRRAAKLSEKLRQAAMCGHAALHRLDDSLWRAEMVVGSWFRDLVDGRLTRYLVGAPVDAKGKAENIVARCVVEHEAR